MSSSDENFGKTSDGSSDESQNFSTDWDPDKAVFTFPRMISSNKIRKRKRGDHLPPLYEDPPFSNESDSIEERDFTYTPKKKRESGIGLPTALGYPKLPPSPTYHSSKPQPTLPEPVEEDSFHDLVEENNELRTRLQIFERIDEQFIEAALSIGEVAFSDPAEPHNTEPLEKKLRSIDSPTSEACLILLEKLTETRQELAASRAREGQQFIRIEELDDASHSEKILLERIGLLEESNEVLEKSHEVLRKDNTELGIKALSKALRLQETERQIKTLVEANKRFKEIQIGDKATILRLQAEVEDLKDKKYDLEQQNFELNESQQVYRNKLESLQGSLQEEKPAGQAEFNPTHKKILTGSSEAYDVENKKAAAGLAGLMDSLNEKDSASILNPLSFESPRVYMANLEGMATAFLEAARESEDKQKEFEKNAKVAEASIKELQAENTKLKEALEAQKSEPPGDPKADPCAEVLAKQNEIHAAALKVLEDKIKALKSCDDVRAELALIKKQKEKEKESSSDPPDGDDALKKEVEALKKENARLEAELKPLKLCDDVRKELEKIQKENADLKKKLEKPGDANYKKELEGALAKQKLRYLKRIHRLNTLKQEQMFSTNDRPPTTLGDLLKQDGPPIKEYNDSWFADQWDELYDRVVILCNINYSGRPDHQVYEYGASATREELLSYYLRDTVLSENAMAVRINEVAKPFGHTYRANIAVAIVFRILVEEIFEPIRFLLNLQFQDPTQRWKTKSQLRVAFERFGVDERCMLGPSFQKRSSWCTRSAEAARRKVEEAKDPIGPEGIKTDPRDYYPKRREDETFNYLREMENKNYEGDADNGRLIYQP